jgi:ribosomal protein S18 acetylase RimI-like enzyme
VICSLQEAGAREAVLPQIRNIFFESSVVKEFSNAKTKQAFYQKWLGVYIDHFSDNCFVSLDESDNVLGYIICCPDTLKNFKVIYGVEALVWRDHYSEYPAHFHINCHSSSRGMGLGSKLLQHLENILKERGVSGVHLTTAKGAENVSFYQKNSYQFIAEEKKLEATLILLAKKLI